MVCVSMWVKLVNRGLSGWRSVNSFQSILTFAWALFGQFDIIETQLT